MKRGGSSPRAAPHPLHIRAAIFSTPNTFPCAYSVSAASFRMFVSSVLSKKHRDRETERERERHGGDCVATSLGFNHG